MWEEMGESEAALVYTAIGLPPIELDSIFSDIQTAHDWASFSPML